MLLLHDRKSFLCFQFHYYQNKHIILPVYRILPPIRSEASKIITSFKPLRYRVRAAYIPAIPAPIIPILELLDPPVPLPKLANAADVIAKTSIGVERVGAYL
ncbi:hypothetical protein DERP_010164 [Dermatophagoides pteronyssinus]|uniref:Uncharacterized protein n=1 Tax=Dermatophagoides pteronyssinus TaxID=6956 RepID=A0ABQ8J6U0_DERPT|nr:hypothetical protein DERP_010164 [Dermatophagoides pteronyssinus]